MKIYLVRHGQSESNIDPNLHLSIKDHNIKLTGTGIEQACRAGVNLEKISSHFNYAFVSPYERTRSTWKNISQYITVDTVIETPVLREQEFKVFTDVEDMKLKKQSKEAYGAFWYRYKNGESNADVYNRVLNFWNDLRMRYLLGEIKSNDKIIIVSHEIVLRMFLMMFKNTKHEDCKIDIANCEVQELVLDHQLKLEDHLCHKID